MFKREVIYICFSIYAVLFGCIVAHPYWIIYLAPFLELLIIDKGVRWFRINILVESVIALFYMVAAMFKFPVCFASDVVSNMLIAYLSGYIHAEYEGRLILEYEPVLLQFSDVLGKDSIIGVATGIFIAGLVTLAFTLSPSLDLSRYCMIESKNVEKSVLYFRILAGYSLCLIPVIIYMDLWKHWVLK